MNKIYSLIFNTTSGIYQVSSELAKGHGGDCVVNSSPISSVRSSSSRIPFKVRDLVIPITFAPIILFSSTPVDAQTYGGGAGGAGGTNAEAVSSGQYSSPVFGGNGGGTGATSGSSGNITSSGSGGSGGAGASFSGAATGGAGSVGGFGGGFS